MELTPMTDHHRQALADLWLASTIHGHPFIPPSYWQDKVCDIRDIYLAAADTVAAWEGDRPLGFISVQEGGFIGGLFVSPAAEGKGVGRALLQGAQERYPALSLAVYEENERAFRFYHKAGFVPRSSQPSENTGHLEIFMEWLASPTE